MLSREVHLNEKLLTEPGVYKGHKTRKLNGAAAAASISGGTSSSHGIKYKKAMKTSPSSSQFNSSNSLTQMLPR